MNLSETSGNVSKTIGEHLVNCVIPTHVFRLEISFTVLTCRAILGSLKNSNGSQGRSVRPPPPHTQITLSLHPLPFLSTSLPQRGLMMRAECVDFVTAWSIGRGGAVTRMARDC